MANDLTHNVLLDAAELGETLLAAGRTAIENKTGLSPVEVFFTGVAHSGVHTLEHVVATIGGVETLLEAATIDLEKAKKILVSFGASSDSATALTPSPAAASTGQSSTV